MLTHLYNGARESSHDTFNMVTEICQHGPAVDGVCPRSTIGLKMDDDHARADGMATSMPVECQALSDANTRFIPIFHPLPELRVTKIGKGQALATDQANDANAVFEHAGVFHLMFQTDCTEDDAQPGGICAGGRVGGHAFSHLVSTDGAHWRRLKDALIPMNTSEYDGADGDCDGTVSFPEGIGPVTMWGADCGRGKWPPPDDDAASERSRTSDYPRVAVAFAANASDPFLVKWKKSENNPIVCGPPRATLARSRAASGAQLPAEQHIGICSARAPAQV